MTVAYDLRYASDHFVGIGTYAYGLLDALLEEGDERYQVLWDPRQSHERFDFGKLRNHPRVTWVERADAPLGAGALFRLGAWLRSVKPAVYFSPFHFLPFGAGCPTVVTIHDVRPLRFRRELPFLRQMAVEAALRRARGAQRLVTVSEFSRREILALLKPREDVLRVVRPGALPHLAALAPRRPAAAPDGAFALVIGDNRPHKNLAMLARAWAALGAMPDLALVAAGPIDGRHPALDELVRKEGGAPAIALGRVTEPELTWLYRNAEMLLFPSRYEGFGSPVAEALTHGTPVLASDLPVLREFADGAARFAPTDDATSWTAAIRDLHVDASARARLREAGLRRAAELRYADAARACRAVLREVAA